MPEQESVHSEEIHEIITAIPSWIVRWGITVFLVILIMIVWISAWIKTPDKIQAELTVFSLNVPEEIVPLRSGKLLKLLVKEDDRVDSGQVLGFLESNSNYSDIILVKEVIDSIQANIRIENFEKLLSINLPNNNHLGELQISYQQFFESFISFKEFLSNGIYSQKANLINKELSDLRLIYNSLQRQLNIQQEDYAISEKEFLAYKQLAEGNVISPLEFKREESKLLNKQLPLQNTQNAIINNRTQQNIKQQQLLELSAEVSKTKVTFLSNVNDLKSKIDAWDREYVLKSTISGLIVFTDNVSEGKWVEPSKTLFYIMSKPDENRFMGELIVQQFAFGKVEVGQEVIIRFNAFPSQEFGQIKGSISYISAIKNNEKFFKANVTLPSDLRTNYKKHLDLKEGFTAQADIITKETSLLERIFNNLYAILAVN